jgi:hypothetical protein
MRFTSRTDHPHFQIIAHLTDDSAFVRLRRNYLSIEAGHNWLVLEVNGLVNLLISDWLGIFQPPRRIRRRKCSLLGGWQDAALGRKI